MDSLGINFGYLFIQVFNLALVGGWLVLAVVGLFQLRHLDLPEIARAIWALVILVIPIAGALAFWIVRPGRQSQRTDSP